MMEVKINLTVYKTFELDQNSVFNAVASIYQNMWRTVVILMIPQVICNRILLNDFMDIAIDQNQVEPDNGINNWSLIYPGTKWCGTGNVADNDNDLGKEKDTDICCRAHDMCPDIIEAQSMKHGLNNTSFYTRLNCDCDDDFRRCLKSVHTTTSSQVGYLYFTGIGTKCFRYAYPIAGCNKHESFPREKCLEYIYNKGLPKQYQWFDVPNY